MKETPRGFVPKPGEEVGELARVRSLLREVWYYCLFGSYPPPNLVGRVSAELEEVEE